MNSSQFAHPGQTDLPKHLVVQFWQDIAQQLHERHHLSTDEARRRIVAYRRELREGGVGDMIYHEEATHIASALAQSCPEPEPR